MSQKLPEFGNPLLLAEQGRRFSGVLPLSRCPRLTESLADDRGEARFEIAFTRDADAGAQVRGELQARLPLTCQRCLGRFEFPVQRHWRLTLIEDPAEEQTLGEDQNVFLVPEGGTRLSDFIEDELILALPLVPRHADGRCSLPGEASASVSTRQDKSNPFASLEALKKK